MENELQIQIVQNLVPVVSAKIELGGGAKVVFGDTMTGTGTPTDPVNVSGDILSQISNNTQSSQNNASQIQNLQNTIADVSNQLATVQDVIPTTASPQNQLADQGFVNSSIQTATAYFRGDWATWADVPSDPSLYPADATGNHTPITNDYMVVIADEQENGGTWRYKYTGSWAEQGKSGWMPEYQVNETPLTAAQLAALNSGVTAQVVASIADKQDKGDYATKDDLTSYVKNTDYATGSTGGVIKINNYDFGTQMNANGFLGAYTITKETYNTADNRLFVGKGTLENIKDDLVKRGITANTITLTAEEQTSARTWLNAVGKEDYSTSANAGLVRCANTYGMTLIERGLINALTVNLGTYSTRSTAFFIGKGTLENIKKDIVERAVSEDGAVLSGYVKNTDYAVTDNNAGIVKILRKFGLASDVEGIRALVRTLQNYENDHPQMLVSKGTLDNVLTQYSKAPTVTEQNENSVELADNTIYNAGEIASLTITFPTVDLKYTSQLNFTSGATATAFTAPATIKWAGDSIVDGAFVPETNKRYVILFYYDGVNICAIAKGE